MSGGAGRPSSGGMVLVETEVSFEVLWLVGGVVDRSVAVVVILAVTRLWESWSIIGLGGIRFGCTVSIVALDVCALAHRDGVQSIVDVSFGIFRGRIFELSFIAFTEAIMFVFVECVLLLLLLIFSLYSNSEFAITLFLVLFLRYYLEILGCYYHEWNYRRKICIECHQEG